MAIQGSGQIKLTELATEFGGTAPYSLKAYYRGGGRVPSNNTIVPASGAIGLKNFYSAVNRIALTVTLGANTTETSLTSATVPGYIAGITDLTVYVSSGVYVYSTSTSSPALTLATGFVAGDTVSLINNGFIMGMGGAGSGAGGGPFNGGPAMSLGYNTTLTNNSYIAGGGGGGAAFTNVGAGGGAGGGSGGAGSSTPGGAGGAIGLSGATGVAQGSSCGGGGGGRILPGTGGTGFGGGTVANGGGAGGGGGAGAGNPVLTGDATFVWPAAGAGGGGGWGAAGGFAAFGLTTNPLASGGNGGSANSAGSPATRGGVAGTTGTPGSGGKAINLNGYTVTYIVTGTLYGTVS
jgi:hypothetical protein